MTDRLPRTARSAGTARHLDLLRQDLRLAWRQLARAPAFTVAALLTLALGIGANSALFSVVDGVLLSPLPYPQPDRLVELRSLETERGFTSGVSLHDFADWRRHSRSFAHLAAWSSDDGNLATGGAATRVTYARVAGDPFAAFGVAPALGRTFSDAEREPGRGDVAVVSHGFWQRHLGAGTAALGRELRLDGRALTVVGVLPPGSAVPEPGVDLVLPLAMTPEQTGARDGRWLAAVGRLAPGVELADARREMETVAARLAAAHPQTNRGWSVGMEPLLRATVGGAGRALLLLWAVVGLVLVLAGFNLAGLLLARAAERRREMAVRAALGAGRGRLLRQLLTESLSLAALGGLLGLAVALGAVRLLPRLVPELPRVDAVAVDLRTLAFTAALAVAAGVLFGLVPALEAGGWRLAATLTGGRSTDPRRRRGWNLLVAAEVALAVTVLVAAGVLLGSFTRLLAADLGFDADRLLTLRVEPPSRVDFAADDVLASFAADRRRAADFYDALLERIAALPGVEAAAAANRRPLVEGGAWSTGLFLEGDGPDVRRPPVRWRAVTPGYLETLGSALWSGRSLRARDDAGAPPVVVVSRSLAEAYWPGEDPLGRRVSHSPPGASHILWYTVVGVVADARHDAPADPPPPVAFVPMRQARFGFFTDWGMDLLVRTTGEPLPLADALRRQVSALDPELPAFAVTTLRRARARHAAEPRLATLLVGAFALLALVLASAGLFGLLSYRVARGRHEIGVRMALGAGRRREVIRVVGGALAAGMLRSLLGEVRLYEVRPADPLPYLLAVALLTLAAVAACTLPALRAAGTEPASVLRGP